MDFSSLPSAFQQLIERVENQYGLAVTPLHQIGGGRTGALVFLVSTNQRESRSIEHYIMKLVHKQPGRALDETQRHRDVEQHSPAAFANVQIPRLVLCVEDESAAVLFYTIAGHSLLRYQPLGAYEQQHQLELLFQAVAELLLEGWNAGAKFVTGIHPCDLLKIWLGYRLTARGNLIPFFENDLRLPATVGGLLIGDEMFPNPLAFGLQPELWGGARRLDVLHGLQHGDLNIANLLATFSESEQRLDGLSMIDFALFKAGMPLFYDLRYLEISFLLRDLEERPPEKVIALALRSSKEDIPDPRMVPVELAGTTAAINAGRAAFHGWAQRKHPSLVDDLWAQWMLAAVAAGLNFCNKPAISFNDRLVGLVYASAHLKRFCTQFGIPLPSEAGLLSGPNALAGQPAADQATRSSVAGSLPVHPTVFIGRKRETGEVKDLLLQEEIRLVTLTGPGGTGKTRLALRVAEGVAGKFANGTVFVSLAEIRQPDLLVMQIADRCGLRQGGSLSLFEILQSYLRDRQTLLVLDNFEQIAAAAPLLNQILAGAPGVKILVTSRLLLHLQGEWEYSVPPLSLPVPSDDSAADAVAGSEAVQLFITRARAYHPRFSLEGDNQQVVAEICRRLDGLPLAIELAAARTRLLPPRMLLARLDDRLGLLTTGARDLPDRQQTLRKTIDWSYDLLEAAHKTLFTRLSVFVGGFTIEAVEGVCNPQGELNVLEGIDALMSSSLLTQDISGDEPRFSMLETIHAYALEKLRESGELPEIKSRHAAYYAEIMHMISSENIFYTGDASQWIEWVSREHENLRAVVDWSKNTPEHELPGILTVIGMFWYWYRRGNMYEGREWCSWALSTQLGKQPTLIKGLLMGITGTLLMHMSEFDQAEAIVEEVLQIGYAIEEDNPITMGHIVLGAIALNRGDDDRGKQYLEKAVELSEAVQFDWGIADALLLLATALQGQGDIDGSVELVHKAEAAAQRAHDYWLMSYVYNSYGESERLRGNYQRAGAYYRQGELLLRDKGDTGGEFPRLVHSLGYVYQRLGDLDAADEQFRESLKIFRKIGNRRGIAECLAGIAGVWAERGYTNQAAVLLSASWNLLESIGAMWWPADRMEYQRNLAAIQAEMTAAEFQAAWEKGRGLGLEETLQFGLMPPQGERT